MNKYNRRHGNNNLGGAMFWLIFAGIAAYGIWKVVEFRRKLNEVQKIEREVPRIEPSPYQLPVDSISK